MKLGMKSFSHCQRWVDNDIGYYGVRFRRDGTLITEPGGELIDFDMSHSNHTIAPSNYGQFWMTWRDENNVLYINKYTLDFEPVFDEPVEICEAEEDVSDLELVTDENEGVYLLWNINSWMTRDIHYTHILGDGSIANPEYGEQGAVLSDAWFAQTYMRAIPDGEGGVLTVWNDWRGSQGDQEGDDVYAMRINDFTVSSGNRDYAVTPGTWQLDAAYPNPFNPSTTLSFAVPNAGHVRLTVFDVLGREVTRLVDGTMTAGEYSYRWAGTNQAGHMVASGVYFYRLEGSGFTRTRSMILLK